MISEAKGGGNDSRPYFFPDRGFCVAACGMHTECPILSGGIAAVSVS